LGGFADPSTTGNAVYIADSAPGGTYTYTALNFSEPVGPVGAGDFNHDGCPDLVVGAATQMEIFLGDCKGDFQQTASYPTGTGATATSTVGGLLTSLEPSDIAVADFDGDGHLDIIYTIPGSSLAKVLYGNGDGTFVAGNDISLPHSSIYVTTADLNSDGNPDLIFTGQSLATIYYGQKSRSYGTPTVLAAGYTTGKAVVSDLNRDGNPDIVVPNLNYDGGDDSDDSGFTFTVFLNQLAPRSTTPVTATTTTTLTSSLNPSTYGQPVTFTATVTSASGTPTGSISFMSGGATLGTVALNSNGVAQFTTSSLPANDLGTTANDEIIATYIPSGGFNGSTGYLYQVVNGLPTTTTVAVTPNPSTYGQPVIFSAHVAPVTPNTLVPTGRVRFTFCRGATTDATLDAFGNATFVSPVPNAISEPVSSCAFTGQYFGDTIFAASTSATDTYIVTPAPSTTTILSASPNPAYFSQPVSFTVQVAGIPSPTADPVTGNPIPPGILQATGTVNLYDSGVLIGSGSVAAVPAGYQAVITTSTLSVGSHTITASYSGDANLGGSVSPPVTEVITAAPPPDFSLTGTSITFKVLHSGTGDLDLASINNFAGSVALTCNPPYPANYTCTLQYPSISLTAGESAVFTFTLNYTETASVRTKTRTILAAFFPLTFLSLIGLARKRRTTLRTILSLALLAILTTATTACDPDHFIPITTGTFPITFTATGTSQGTSTPITHTLTINASITP
jgi:hypothetical protein